MNKNIIFEDVNSTNLRFLVEILSSNNVLSLQFIKNLYGKRSKNFDAVLQFLVTCEFVSIDEDKIIELSGRFFKLSQHIGNVQEFNFHLIDFIASSKNIYGTALRSYIMRFEKEPPDGSIYLRMLPVGDEHYATRDFLISAGALKLNFLTGTCTLEDTYNGLHESLFKKGWLPPDKLDEILDEQKKVGAIAEEAVFDYEIHKTEDNSHLVFHESKVNAAAGYDIKSVRTNPDESLKQIYIEVKAVRPSDLRFFWSKGEREAAKRLSSRYYLYLVPIIDCLAVTTEMMIIQNPIVNLLNANSDWEIIESTVECIRR